MFLKPKHFIFECRPNFGSFCPIPGLLRAITFSAPKPPPLQISAYATVLGYKMFVTKQTKSFSTSSRQNDNILFKFVKIFKFINPRITGNLTNFSI